MRSWKVRLAHWSNSSDYTALDLGVFRIIFSIATLLLLPNYFWISRLDPAFYQPPPGPFALLSSYPPSWVLATLDVVITATLVLLLVGYRTLTASLVLSGSLLIGDGFAYSLGKIDHSILFVLTPLFLGIAGWGRAVSIDARGQHQPTAVTHWAMRAFAVTIGVAFFTAALQKALGGWLSPSSQAAYAYVVQRVGRGRSEWLAPAASNVHFPVGWELVDWATIILEGGLILCAVSWRSWRLGLCAAVTFHVGVLLTLNIDFWMNILAYGSFVLWTHVPRATRVLTGCRSTSRPARVPAQSTLALSLLAATFAIAMFAIVHVLGPLTESLGWVPVFIGLMIALGYLALSLGQAWRARARPDAASAPATEAR